MGGFAWMLDTGGKPLPSPVPASWAAMYGFTPLGEAEPLDDNCGECREK